MFDNSDKDQSPQGYPSRDFPDITVTRQVNVKH